MLGYECEEGFIPPENFGRECGAVPLPGDIGIKCMARMIMAWGVGGNAVS